MHETDRAVLATAAVKLGDEYTTVPTEALRRLLDEERRLHTRVAELERELDDERIRGDQLAEGMVELRHQLVDARRIASLISD